MIELSEKVTIAAPADKVWTLIADPAAVAKCIPGAELGTRNPDGSYPGRISVKFGPTIAAFRGEARISYDMAERHCVIEGRGMDQRGASQALASADISVSGTDATTIAIEGSYNVTGPLETFARMGGVHVARALLAEFAANVTRQMAEQPAPAENATSIAKPAETVTTNIPATKILLKAFVAWLRTLAFKWKGFGS